MQATRNASDMETVSMDLKAVLTRFRNQGAGIPSGVAKEAAERMVLSSGGCFSVEMNANMRLLELHRTFERIVY